MARGLDIIRDYKSEQRVEVIDMSKSTGVMDDLLLYLDSGFCDIGNINKNLRHEIKEKYKKYKKSKKKYKNAKKEYKKAKKEYLKKKGKSLKRKLAFQRKRIQYQKVKSEYKKEREIKKDELMSKIKIS